MEIDGAETVSTSGLRRGRPLLVGDEDARRVHDAMLFPLLLTSLQPDYLVTYRLEPRAVNRTRVVADVLVHPEASDEYLDELTAFWARVNAEDRAICERQQRGLSSRGEVRGRDLSARGVDLACYATVEEGVHAFNRLVARALLEAR